MGTPQHILLLSLTSHWNISLNLSLLEIIARISLLFLENQHNRFTIYHIQNFRPQKLLSVRYHRKKNSNFRFFSGGKSCILESCPYIKLEIESGFAQINGRPFDWATCCDFFRAVKFLSYYFREFFARKGEKLSLSAFVSSSASQTHDWRQFFWKLLIEIPTVLCSAILHYWVC